MKGILGKAGIAMALILFVSACAQKFTKENDSVKAEVGSNESTKIEITNIGQGPANPEFGNSMKALPTMPTELQLRKIAALTNHVHNNLKHGDSQAAVAGQVKQTAKNDHPVEKSVHNRAKSIARAPAHVTAKSSIQAAVRAEFADRPGFERIFTGSMIATIVNLVGLLLLQLLKYHLARRTEPTPG